MSVGATRFKITSSYMLSWNVETMLSEKLARKKEGCSQPLASFVAKKYAYSARCIQAPATYGSIRHRSPHNKQLSLSPLVEPTRLDRTFVFTVVDVAVHGCVPDPLEILEVRV